ncbi:hypothetical protein QE152_g19756 [Popillia japonica]|uniref:Secreted protein n=1 Tax=Popillia japonica TaxID=7064 RepID=A0AAW1KQD2_POPJA
MAFFTLIFRMVSAITLNFCCQKDASTPATCANCGGDHPASYQGCPAHVAYKEARDKASADSRNRQRPKPNTRRVPARAFIPAPPPLGN